MIDLVDGLKRAERYFFESMKNWEDEEYILAEVCLIARRRIKQLEEENKQFAAQRCGCGVFAKKEQE